MIDFNFIWAIIFVIFLALFLSITLMTRYCAKSFDKNKFSFARNFPFEAMNNIEKGYSLYKVLLFAYIAISFVSIFAFIGKLGFYENLSFLTIIINVLFGFGNIVILFLFFFNPSNVKTQSILVSISATIAILCGALTGVLSFNIYSINLQNSIPYLPQILFGALAIFFALADDVSIFTFGLKDWARLEVKKEGSLERPKFFPLAAFEWLTFFTLFIEQILFLLILIKY